MSSWDGTSMTLYKLARRLKYESFNRFKNAKGYYPTDGGHVYACDIAVRGKFVAKVPLRRDRQSKDQNIDDRLHRSSTMKNLNTTETDTPGAATTATKNISINVITGL